MTDHPFSSPSPSPLAPDPAPRGGPELDDLPARSIDHDRQALLKGGLTTNPEALAPADPNDGPTMVPHAHLTLLSVMHDPMAKGAERVAAADSILDRYGTPRKRVDQGGGSKQVIFNLSPDAFAGVAQGIAALAGGNLDPLPAAPPAPRNVTPVHGEGPDPHTSQAPQPSGGARGSGKAGSGKTGSP